MFPTRPFVVSADVRRKFGSEGLTKYRTSWISSPGRAPMTDCPTPRPRHAATPSRPRLAPRVRASSPSDATPGRSRSDPVRSPTGSALYRCGNASVCRGLCKPEGAEMPAAQ